MKCLGSLLLAVLLGIPCAYAHGKKKTEIDLARDRMIEAKSYKVYYSNKFDLSGLPSYRPERKVSGTIRMWGANYFTDSPLAGYWEPEPRRSSLGQARGRLFSANPRNRAGGAGEAELIGGMLFLGPPVPVGTK